MNCEEIKEVLYDYIKNEVTVREISEIETHIKACADCASELAHIKGISSLIKASMEEPHDSVLLNIARSIKPAARKQLNWLKPALAAAMVLVVSAAGFILYNRPYKVEMAEVPDEIAASYALVDASYYEEDTDETDNSAVEEPAADEGYYAGNSSGYTGGYTPVSYIIGQ